MPEGFAQWKSTNLPEFSANSVKLFFKRAPNIMIFYQVCGFITDT
jgi:hypothetical protein